MSNWNVEEKEKLLGLSEKLNGGVCGHKVLINQLCQNNRKKIAASEEHQAAAALGFIEMVLICLYEN